MCVGEFNYRVRAVESYTGDAKRKGAILERANVAAIADRIEL